MRNAIRAASGLLAQRRGNILVYVVVTMVIFAVLGAAMVSLFSTSVTSSAVRNDARRAAYLSESGLRYAMSELRGRDFSRAVVDDLNGVTYEVDQAGNIALEVFAHQFRSLTDQVKSTGETLALNKDKGEIFGNFLAEIPTESPYLSIVNLDSMSAYGSATYNTADISGAGIDGDSFVLTLADDFSVSRNNYVAFAVAPHQAKTLTPNGDGDATIEIKPAARSVFPKRDGAFYIGTDPGRVYFYQSYEDLTDRLKLKNITADPLNKDAKSKGATAPVEVKTDDLIILSENNYVLSSRGRAGEAAFGGGMDHAAGIANPSLLDELKDVDRYDIGDETLTYETDTKPGGDFRLTSTGELFALDSTEKTISIGGGSGASFGALWFSDTRSIGGKQNFCVAGACEFGRGIRAFFTFSVAAGSDGDGFIFSIINGEKNSINSVGGDIQQSELLGYAGDSRTEPPPAAPAFLDGSGKGLQAPKIGLEFDTRVNYSAAFEETQKFCSDSNNLKPDTRNDPLTSDKHAVQYVFWGKEFPIDVSCRPTASRKTYDDNRHDAVGFASGNWSKNLFGNTNSAPAVGTDGTIYIGSAATKLYAVNPDGTTKWEFSTPSGNVFSPVIRGDRIYVSSSDNRVYAVNRSSGNLEWSVPTGGTITERPAVDLVDGFVYVTSSNSIVKIQDGTTKNSIFPGGVIFTSPPVLSNSRSTVYHALNDNKLHARTTETLEELPGWPSSVIGAVVGAPVVAPGSGFIFVSAGNSIVKINPSNPTATPATFSPGSFTPTSSPALSRDGTRVYVGFDNGKLYALDAADLSPISGLEFPFPAASSAGTRITTPLVDGSENIYFGSDNGYVYALYADGSVKWEFNTGGAVNATPAIDKNGTVYAGSNYLGGQLWAINQFTEPRNYRQNFEGVAADSELAKNLIAYSAPHAVNPYFSTTPVYTNKWFKDGPWAVRFEIDRIGPTEGKADYTLRTWVQQCTDINCTNVRGTFFANTRVRYAPSSKPPNLVQSFELDATLNTQFDRFLFGFNSAKRSTDDQVITIDNFQLSFIRPGDPESDVE